MHTPSLTKIDSQGNALPADATEWFAVRVIDGSIRFDMLAGHVGDTRMNHADATAACAALDSRNTPPWRLPTSRELFAIVDHSRFAPAVYPTFFEDMESTWYWTSSPDASDPEDYAWIVGFHGGYVNLSHRDGSAWVRAVRSAPASQ